MSVQGNLQKYLKSRQPDFENGHAYASHEKTDADREFARSMKHDPTQSNNSPYRITTTGSPMSKSYNRAHGEPNSETVPDRRGSVNSLSGSVFGTDASDLENTVIDAGLVGDGEVKRHPHSQYGVRDGYTHDSTLIRSNLSRSSTPLDQATNRQRSTGSSKEGTRFTRKDGFGQHMQSAQQAGLGVEYMRQQHSRKRSHQSSQSFVHHLQENFPRAETIPSDGESYDGEDDTNDGRNGKPTTHKEEQESLSGDVREPYLGRLEASVTPKRQARQSPDESEVVVNVWEDIQPEFSNEQMRNMSFSQVAAGIPWDPPVNEKEYKLPTSLKGMTVEEKVDYYLEHSDASQMRFYSSLDRDDWDKAGDHIVSKIADAFKQYSESQKKKRTITEKYEQALKLKEERIQKESVELDRVFDDMKNGGEKLIHDKQ